MNNYRETACKMHQLNPSWTEQTKTQYIKHALRETQTHKTLNHPNIVKLYETFELDQNTLHNFRILQWRSIFISQTKQDSEGERCQNDNETNFIWFEILA